MATGAEAEYLKNRVNLPNQLSSTELAAGLPEKIRAQSFFSARVAEAHILDRFRQVSDDYNTGKIGRDEARNLMLEYARANGKDDGTKSLKNLASSARLNLILDQNRKQARAVYDYQKMYSPAAQRVFPYLRFHASVGSKVPRKSHGEWNGMICRKDDPFVQTHWPPLDFGCNCRWENCTQRTADEDPKRVREPWTNEQAEKDFKTRGEKGYVFDPAHAFEEADLTSLTPVSRKSIINTAADAVKNGKLGKCGMIAAPPATGNAPAPLPNLPRVKSGFDAMKNAARQELADAGLDPDHLPDYETVNQAFNASKKVPENIPRAVIEHFPKEPIEVTTINSRVADAADIPSCPVTLERGTSRRGIAHLWTNHKDLFADPDKAVRLLEETLGDPNCRVVVGLEPITIKQSSHGNVSKVQDCLKRIIVHSPAKKAYCVMNYNGNTLKLVSWHNAEDEYGSEKWALK